MHIKSKTLLVFAVLPAIVVLAAYVQWGLFGLPATPQLGNNAQAEPFGFPGWLRLTHYINILFLVLLGRSGLQILMDHPRLYWNVHCTPGTEWLRLTPIKVPEDRVWTSKDDSRYLSPWIGLPGHRHTVGMARHWHFLSALFWIANGIVFVSLLFSTEQWKRLVPTSWQIFRDAWSIFVHYATLHLPAEPNGFYHYNALQQLTYFGVVFILTPLAIVTGPSMSPALTNRFKWYPTLPGNRQIGRSLHFLIMCAFVVFTILHVALVVITGFIRNMNHIAMGTDDTSLKGVYLGLAGLGLIVAVNALAYWLAWRHPRFVQHIAKAIVTPTMKFLLDRPAPLAEFRREDISPFFWPNGKQPTCQEWKTLADGNFKGYRLKVFGAVENPVDLSLDDLRTLEKKTQITLHHCIQGWSGIAEWGGLPLSELIELVRPRSTVKRVVLRSFGDGIEFTTGASGGRYYDSLSMTNAMHPHTLLAYEMNGEPLTELHGAPLRLRVENQLGFKMVKWIESIEFVENIQAVGMGEGGYAEDHEYFGELANI